MKRAFCKFHKRCYFSEEVERKNRLMAEIRRGKAGPFACCILLSENPNDQLEIVPASSLCKEYYRMHPAMVYGAALSKDGAIRTVAHIFHDAERAGLPGDVRSYLMRLGS